MAEFPAEPVSPVEFMEQLVPKLFAATDLPASASEVDVKLGMKLEGEDGGEWLFHLEKGALHVQPGSRKAAAFSVLQSVDDWRGALWEGRGGVFGELASTLFRLGGSERQAAAQGAVNPAALAQLANLDGVIKLVVTAGDGGDWTLAIKLGAGELPEEPTTTVTVAACDAAAMQSGELDAMQAFMSGKIQVAGDMTLMMQLQAILMQARQAG